MNLQMSEIFKKMFTEERWKGVGIDLLTALDTDVSSFVKDNVSIAGEYTEEQMKGLLFSKVLQLPATVELTSGVNSTEEEILIVSRINKARAAAHALIIDIQAFKNEHAAKLESAALKFVSNVGQQLLTIAITGVTSGLAAKAIGG